MNKNERLFKTLWNEINTLSDKAISGRITPYQFDHRLAKLLKKFEEITEPIRLTWIRKP